ncbi:MAG: competence/damage-inducible protein A [Myxococcales bacterium]|nr:competence/damage-inducible protein A [Myxococcales bacterium]
MQTQRSDKDQTGSAPLTATLLTIGDELSRGEIIDSNAAFLGSELTALGVYVRKRVGCNDRLEDIVAALDEAAQTGSLIVASGGLGPTSDDLTVDAVSAWLGVQPVQEPVHEERMRRRFIERNFAITPNNLRQVRIPSGATVLANRTGAAPGFAVQKGEVRAFFLPGVPKEMKPMFVEQAIPLVRQLLPPTVTVRRIYRTLGLGESHVDHRLADLLDVTEARRHAQQVAVTIHYRLAFPEVLVTLLARGEQADQVEAALAVLDEEVRRRLGHALYGTGEDELAAVVERALLERGQTLATAESCTGGMIGQTLTAVPGSSAYYLGGIVAYDNSVKRGVLGVSESTLTEHGAVSEACVRQMAESVRKLLGTTYGVAVSGIAGPGGGTQDKPVGTVWLAASSPERTLCRLIQWPGDREQVRKIATAAALNLVHKLMFPERLSDAALRL